METPSEDEVEIRKLLDTWVETFNSHDLPKMSSLYVENAKWSTQAGGTGVHTFQNRQEVIYQGFSWHAKHGSTISNFKIGKLAISNDAAEVQSRFYFATEARGLDTSATYNLVKISETVDPRQPNAKMKLPKPIWRISFFESFF